MDEELYEEEDSDYGKDWKVKSIIFNLFVFSHFYSHSNQHKGEI